MNAIKTFDYTTPEYKRLQKSAVMLTEASEHGTFYRVETIYFDYGQDWLWTTLVAHTADGNSYQALSPREQEDLLFTENIFEALHKVTTGHSWTNYCVNTR